MDNAAVTIAEEQRGTAARSAFYQQLAGSFVYPGGGTSGATAVRTRSAALHALLADLPHDDAARQALGQALADLDDWARTPDATLPLAPLHTALFDHCRGPAMVSLYEKDYGNGEAKMVWEELIRFYEHFGLAFDLRLRKDWPDHIGTELEFLHFLTFLEAAAAPADRGNYALAAGDFLSRRLARWAPRFARTLGGAAQASPYARFATLIATFVDAEMALLRRENGYRGPWVPIVGI